MATPEPLEPSRRLSQAARAEHERLAARLEKIEERAGALSEQLRQLQAERDDLNQRIGLLHELLPGGDGGGDRHLRPVQGEHRRSAARETLRGAAIRRIAVQVLVGTERATKPIHYIRWLELVQEAGYEIVGRDPAASFLTQINRSALVERGDRPGLYKLVLDIPTRLRIRLAELHEELLALHNGQQTLEAVVSVRERRDQVLSEIGRAERALEEALLTLGESDPSLG